MFSEKSLSDYIEKDAPGKVNNNNTYIVTSIESAAGSKLPIPSYKDYIENDMKISLDKGSHVETCVLLCKANS